MAKNTNIEGAYRVIELQSRETYKFEDSTGVYRFVVEWSCLNGVICDLDLGAVMVDERGRFVEKLTSDIPKSRDGSSELQSDIDSTNATGSYVECVATDFLKVDTGTQGIVFFLDGGTRNFQHIQSITFNCFHVRRENGEETYSSTTTVIRRNSVLFTATTKAHRNYQGVILFCIYKNGWTSNGYNEWHAVSLMEPLYVTAVKEKEEKCEQMAIQVIPALAKFKPKIFGTVRQLCAALSSQTLPRLKVKFAEPLPILKFVKTLFRQLYSLFPNVIDPLESGYTVAMLEEMFHQIDFNGDGTVDWDEFTTFCIQTGLAVTSVADDTGGNVESLDEYVIEYSEEKQLRDKYLSPHRLISLMRYIPDVRRVLIITDNADHILFFDEKFRMRSQLYPGKLQLVGNNNTVDAENEDEANKQKQSNPSSVVNSRIVMYDAIYLTGRELYAYCASDHTITICREKVIGARTHYILHNQFFHTLLHIKLCWSPKSKILCSVASDKVIYGWDIDGEKPLFQISRHSDIITDMIAIDHYEVFATCSMDKRIVLWSSHTRRVKGVLIGHKRGVRCMDVFESIMLSAAFETTARIWDLVSKDCVAVLKGHRKPITAAKLMCQRAQCFEEHRAISVDEGGEFRLWNVFIKERSSEPLQLPTLQVFEMTAPENPLYNMRFLAFPYDSLQSTSYYSDMIACSTKLFKFLPEKSTKEFIPATACVINHSSSCVITAIGKSVLKYDLYTGEYLTTFSAISKTEITSIALDGDRGRRMYLGCTNGDIMFVNFMSGTVLAVLSGAHTREVTAIATYVHDTNSVFTGSADGRLRMLEEDSGALHVHNSVEEAFGEGIGIQAIEIVPELEIIVVSSNSTKWGIWNSLSFKKVGTFEEDNVIAGIHVIGVSGNEEFPSSPSSGGKKLPKIKPKKLLTVALAFAHNIQIYTLDIVEIVGVISHIFSYNNGRCEFGQLTSISVGINTQMNYPAIRDTSAVSMGSLLVASLDDGYMLCWPLEGIKEKSEEAFAKNYESHGRLRHSILSPLPLKTDKILAKIAQPQSQKSTPRTTSRKNSPRGDDTGRKRKKSSGNIDSTSKPNTARSLEDAHKLGPKASFGVNVLNAFKNFPHGNSDDSESDEEEEEVEAEVIVPLATTEFKDTGFGLTFTSEDVFGDFFGAKEIQPCRSWRGHMDQISAVLPLFDHGCIVTVSLDGFHRVWNLDGVCLGEMALPNITESMKNPLGRCVKKTSWKFILEHLIVTENQQDLADSLVFELVQANSNSTRHSPANVPGNDSSIFDLTNVRFSEESTSDVRLYSAKDRLKILDSLNEVFEGPKDLPPTFNEISERLKPKKFHQGSLLENSVTQQGSIAMSFMSKGDTNTVELEASTFTADQTISQAPFGASASHFQSISGSHYSPKKSMSTDSLWQLSQELKFSSDYAVPPAFSDVSLFNSHHAGLIDGEGYKILQKVSAHPEKVRAFNHASNIMMLRNPSLTSSVQIPKLSEVRNSEMKFGSQIGMYKNADAELRSRGSVNKQLLRHYISVARIDTDIKKVNSMLHFVSPFGDHDEFKLNGDSDDSQVKARLEEAKMRERIEKSAMLVSPEARMHERPLDKDLVGSLVKKVLDAESFCSESERKEKDELQRLEALKKQKIKEKISTQAREAIEKRLAHAIRSKSKMSTLPTLDSKPEKKAHYVPLTNRMLLPFYKLADIDNFLELIAKVDEDLTGDIDLDEWIKLFGMISESLPVHEVKLLFLQVDSKDEGTIMVRDIVPIVFSKADKAQLKAIIGHCENEIVCKRQNRVYTGISKAELEQLFDCYDTDNIGFVMVSYIRERVRNLSLPEAVQFAFFDSISDIEEDEMVNCQEFLRIFRKYTK